MGLFGFLGAPGRFIERITGERASRQKGTAAREQFDQQRANLAQANAQALAQQKRLQKMLDEISGLDKQQKTVSRDYKNKLKALEYEEQNLKGLGQHYSKTIGEVEAKGNELMSRKNQLEERSGKLEERTIPLEAKLKEIAEQTQQVDGGEIKTLVEQYQQKFKEVEANKEKLKGVSKETSPELFTQHQKMVKSLGALHKQTEETVKSKHTGLSETHKKIALELNRLQKDYSDIESEGRDIRRGQEKLESKRKYIDTYQNMLEPELKKFAEDQEGFKAEAEGLKVFQQKVADLEKGYTAKKSEAEQLQKELVGTNAYQDQLVSRLQSLQKDVEFHAQRYQERAGRSALIKAGAMGLATMGVGSALGVGAGLTNLATGLTVFGTLNSVNNDIQKNLEKFGAYSDFSPTDYKIGSIPDWNKTPLNRVDFKSRVFDTKIKMPEFGGLAQSIKHFEMPTLPTLAELPQLNEALGRIRSLEDVANLGILPGSTARSPNRSLLNPQLMKALKDVIQSKSKVDPLSKVGSLGRASNNNKKKGLVPKRSASLPHPGGLFYEH